jgi:hypothetical protein
MSRRSKITSAMRNKLIRFYLRLGSARTLRAVADEFKIPLRTVQRLSSDGDWKRRAQLFDNRHVRTMAPIAGGSGRRPAPFNPSYMLRSDEDRARTRKLLEIAEWKVRMRDPALKSRAEQRIAELRDELAADELMS